MTIVGLGSGDTEMILREFTPQCGERERERKRERERERERERQKSKLALL